MNLTAHAKERHTIPRWNSINLANRLGELNSAGTYEPNSITGYGENLEQLLDEWKTEKNIPLAVEIISTVKISKIDYNIDDIICFLKTSLRGVESIPPILSAFLTGEESDYNLISPEYGIKEIRAALINYPRNPLLWSELARVYLIHGHKAKCEQAIRTAYQLAPNNRTILRAISRFYAHIRDYDQAKYYLQKTPVLKTDPWILSAEIAISNEAGKTSQHVKTGQRMLDSGDYDLHSLSELASELATLDFFSANAKQGKRKIERVLSTLHENAAAQIVWIDKHVQKIPSIVSEFHTPECNYEADTILEMGKHNWQAAVDNATKWKSYQPFSSSPAMVISYLLSDYLLEYKKACNVLCEAIKANPNNAELLNNYAYALALVGDIVNAADTIKRAKKIDTSESCISIIATEGLVNYRQGNYEDGKKLYDKAIVQAKKRNDQRTLFELYLHLAREEKNCGNNADEIIGQIYSPKFQIVREEFEDVIKNFGLFNGS